MNKLIIVGGIGRDPELKTTTSGLAVCTFSVGVNNRKNKDGQQETTWFRVTAWRQLAEICAKYLRKGSKASVVGSVTLSTYTKTDGSQGASLEVTAEDVEFLSHAGTGAENATVDERAGFVKVEDDEILPF